MPGGTRGDLKFGFWVGLGFAAAAMILGAVLGLLRGLSHG